ncbi:MAG: glycerol-3-phosphate dehydrogenase/oxidase [Promethearchaeota archaeon]
MTDPRDQIRQLKWCSRDRTDILRQLKETTFDIVVIGGGITGAGIAREAQIRGLSAALLEKTDFAWGTSSRSTKMAHGGIRYLKNGEFGLVREATTERNWLRAHFPNLVRPVHFLYPAYAGSSESPRLLKFAVFLYDLLSNAFSKFKNYGGHRSLSAEEVAALEPSLKSEGLVGGVTYYDTNVDDARLTLETVKEAVARGAVALNYAEVVDFVEEGGQVRGVVTNDVPTGEKFEVRGKVVVNATGIWTDRQLREPEPVIRPTKGAHVQFEREQLPLSHAVALRHPKDRRAHFLIPRDEVVVLGTTDTDYVGDPDDVHVDLDDWEYLVESAQTYFPGHEFRLEDAVSAYAGVRPLVREVGKSESAVSRKHVILTSPNGLVTIAGGKLTTFRKMAEDLIVRLVKAGTFPGISKKRNLSKVPYWVGAQREEWDQQAAAYEAPEDVKDHLYVSYGWAGLEVLELAKEQPALAERMVPNRPFIYAEVPHVVERELVYHLTDLLYRRMEVCLRVHPRHLKGVAERCARLAGELLGWDEERRNAEVAEFVAQLRKDSFFWSP